MKISAINQNYIQNNLKSTFKQANKTGGSNNFEFSNISSNAIKSNSLANISFTSKKITQADVIKKEAQVRLKAIGAHSELQNVYYVLAPQWLKEAQDLHTLAQKELSDLISGNSNNKEATQTGFIRYDSFNIPIYSAEVTDNAITKIYSYNIEGEIDKVIEINADKHTIASYQKGYSEDGSYEFKMDYFTYEDGTIVPDVYRAGHKLDEQNFSNYSKVMLFNGCQMMYREGVKKCTYSMDPNGQIIDLEIDFDDINNFSYQKGYSATDGRKPTKSGEHVFITDSSLTYWNKGLETYPDGIQVQSPRIKFRNGKMVEYDMGHKLDPSGNYLIKHNYIKDTNGISDEMLRVLGYLKG